MFNIIDKKDIYLLLYYFFTMLLLFMYLLFVAVFLFSHVWHRFKMYPQKLRTFAVGFSVGGAFYQFSNVHL